MSEGESESVRLGEKERERKKKRERERERERERDGKIEFRLEGRRTKRNDKKKYPHRKVKLKLIKKRYTTPATRRRTAELRRRDVKRNIHLFKH